MITHSDVKYLNEKYMKKKKQTNKQINFAKKATFVDPSFCSPPATSVDRYVLQHRP